MYSIYDEARDKVTTRITDAQRNESVKWIVKNYGHCFQDNITIKTAAKYASMLYSTYIDDKSMNTYSQLEHDVF